MEETCGLYPRKRSAVLPLLHLIQEEKGYLNEEAVLFVAEKLSLKPVQVYEVVTFYPMFRRARPGKVRVAVCRTLPCALAGAYKTLELLEERLAVKRGQTREDGLFSLECVECVANCAGAPVVRVNDNLHEHVDPASVEAFARNLEKLTTLPPSLLLPHEKSPVLGKEGPAFKA